MTATGSPASVATASATAATSSNSRSTAYGSVSPDAPRPRRSIAWIANRRASSGPTTRNVVWSALAPWTSRAGGPSPEVKTAIGVPSVELTMRDGRSEMPFPEHRRDSSVDVVDLSRRISDGSSSNVDTVDRSVRWCRRNATTTSMPSTDRSGLSDIHAEKVDVIDVEHRQINAGAGTRPARRGSRSPGRGVRAGPGAAPRRSPRRGRHGPRPPWPLL